MFEDFRSSLVHSNLAQNTVLSYVWTLEQYVTRYGDFTQENLGRYKMYLVEHYSPQTVNLRLQAINRYLLFTEHLDCKVKFVKTQRRNYLENVISEEDYSYLKKMLISDGQDKWYFVVWFMAATGARVSELLKIKAEHVFSGHFDLYSKGGKTRRIYIPKQLKKEALLWLRREGITSGFIFRNKFGRVLTTRGVAMQLKHYAVIYGLPPEVVYPHSFRHLYAKKFLEKCDDISFLADLLGHESIETTRIYLRRTSMEQRKMIDQVVTW